MASRKLCSHCKKWHPLSKFNKSKGAPDGLQGYCRTCQATYGKHYRTRNAQTLKES